jgi:hypothetical protein
MGRVYARHVLRFLFIIAMLGTWFMPLIIAALYRLPHQGSIAVLSLALGWTGVGWLAALIIAVGGAIRATRPALAGQAQPGVAPQAPAYATAVPRTPAQSAWPSVPAPTERVQAPQRAQPTERAPFPEQTQAPPATPAPPSWPDNPR